MLFLPLTAATYFYFNWQYFSLVRKLGQISNKRLWLILLSFVTNYVYFYICSVLEFPLVINWFFFAFLLFLESFIYNKGNGRYALFSTLVGIIYGLAVNIVCRSVIAIALNEPLVFFDNHTTSAENLKGFPVCLGFLLAGGIMWYLKRSAHLHGLLVILEYPKHQTFLLEMMAGLFFYLFLNLLLYSTPLNDLLLKLWSIKSCLFSMTGLYIAARYTYRVCVLYDYREKNSHIEQELEERRQEEQELFLRASCDVLTGFYNRSYAEETMAAMQRENTGFILCFIDLDGLKYVNDHFGHEEGDRYLRMVAEQIRRGCRSGRDFLCRYGGDEFLVLFTETDVDEARERVRLVNDRLHALKKDSSFPYALSFSYGIVQSPEFNDWRAMIRSADEQMYEQKLNKKTVRGD